jgi:hypothetical protein
MQQLKNDEVRRELGYGLNAPPDEQESRFIIVRTGIYAPHVNVGREPWEFGGYGWINLDD